MFQNVNDCTSATEDLQRELVD